ncbi:unnamed protein product [Blepharisma stoltei]|uniref:Uncharacterized protein n=1 Tax=Blepharisma stoltei TaxID=1481888 RepID=A0AAU9KF31_9CILI|nr:unnamed protein product [Blepharisma stoltei]
MKNKKFDYRLYMKPMISKAGHLISKRNDFLKRVLNSDQSILEENAEETSEIEEERVPTPIETKIQRAIEENNKAARKHKKSKNDGTSSFKVKMRSLNVTDSPPPGRYTPQYEYLLKHSPRVVFGKAKLSRGEKWRDRRPESCDVTNLSESFDIDKKKVKGYTFGKEPRTKNIVEDAREFLRHDLLNISSRSHMAHKFESYPERKPWYRLNEYLPDYTPKISFVSKHIPAVKLN